MIEGLMDRKDSLYNKSYFTLKEGSIDGK